MKCVLMVVIFSGLLLGGCADATHQPAPLTIESYRDRTHKNACRLVTSATLTSTSTLLTFQRAGGDSSVPISVRLVWQPSADPIYSPRGPMLEISVSEGSRSTVIPSSTIHSVEALRQIEDLWPEYVEISSARPGDYDLLLSNGVPAGEGATLVGIRRFAFRVATDLTSAHFQRSQPETQTH